MNIIKNDRVILIKEMDSLKIVGQEFEVANIIRDDTIVLRDAKSKTAVCSIDIESFDEYFAKQEVKMGWTKWTRIVDPDGNMIAEYRTNQKKVEVRIPNNMIDSDIGSNGRVIHSTATCSQGDEFNLSFGIQLAYLRCERKWLKLKQESYLKRAKVCESKLVETKDIMNKMVASLNK